MALLENITYSPGEPIQDMYDKINAAIDTINDVLGGGTTDQIISKVNGTDFNTLMVNSVLPASGVGNIKIKIIDIGDWNMDSSATKNVSHGIADHTKIRSVSVIIREDDADASTNTYVLASPFGGSVATPGEAGMVAGAYRFTPTLVQMLRVAGATFDSSVFNATSYNRGWITIIYEG